jgi:3-phenylpropionate/cinnamic acid dioxygenase small subunit
MREMCIKAEKHDTNYSESLMLYSEFSAAMQTTVWRIYGGQTVRFTEKTIDRHLVRVTPAEIRIFPFMSRDRNFTTCECLRVSTGTLRARFDLALSDARENETDSRGFSTADFFRVAFVSHVPCEQRTIRRISVFSRAP